MTKDRNEISYKPSSDSSEARVSFLPLASRVSSLALAYLPHEGSSLSSSEAKSVSAIREASGVSPGTWGY